MAHGSILIADDEELLRRVLTDTLSEEGYSVETVDSGSRAWDRLNQKSFDLAFFDIRMPDPSGLELLLRAREAQILTPIIIMTGQTTMANAVEAMKRGAFDYLTKPFDLDVVRLLVRRALEARRLSSNVDVLTRELRKRYESGVDLIGQSPAMQAIYKLVGRVAKND